jgi:predicted nucleic acid-binding protein
VSLVLDSSAVLAWVHGDERTTEIEAVFDRVVEKGGIVPHLWHLEVANSLTVAVRRKRVTQAFRDDVLKDLAELNISVDGETAANAWGASVRLADLYGLTIYDAAYLELTQRLRLPLATLDLDLAKAARAAGVEVLP